MNAETGILYLEGSGKWLAGIKRNGCFRYSNLRANEKSARRWIADQIDKDNFDGYSDEFWPMNWEKKRYG